MEARGLRTAFVAALLILMGGACGVLSDEPSSSFASLDAAEEQLTALGEQAFGSEAVEVTQVDSCQDQPALVSAVWNVNDVQDEELREVIVAAAEQAGWEVQEVPGRVPDVRRSIDGVDFALIWTVGATSADGPTRVTLLAQWTDAERC